MSKDLKDPGVFHQAADFLAPYLPPAYAHALVLLDAAWDGAPGDAEMLRGDLLRRLHLRGWPADRCQVVMIAPELEAWVWADSPVVLDVLRTDWPAANLSGANLHSVNLSQANLSQARLRLWVDPWHLETSEGCWDFMPRSPSETDYIHTNLSGANLSGADLSGADLNGANLSRANLSEANLSGADLRQADLSKATLVATKLVRTKLSGCRVYGISAWGVDLEGAKQTNLVITPAGEPAITVDNLEVAQFIYLLLNNEKIRAVIDTITSKVVLILGRILLAGLQAQVIAPAEAKAKQLAAR